MANKDFQKGMEAGAKPFEEKFKQQAAAINRVSDKIEAGLKDVKGVVNEVMDGLSSIEKKQLYDLNTQFDIKNLEDYEKELLLAGLFTLAGETANENQQAFIRSVKKYLGIANAQTQVDLSGIENVESLASQKAMFQVFSEFLFLKNEDDSFYEEYSDFFDNFSVKQKDRSALFENIMRVYKVTGSQGICEKYGYAIDKSSIKAPRVVDNLNITLIEKKVTIAKGEEKKYSAQKIRLLADIVCQGKLVFESCVLTYNSGNISANIRVGEKGIVELLNCTVIDQCEEEIKETPKRKNQTDNSRQEGSFFVGDKDAQFISDGSLFYNCMNFASNFVFKITGSRIRYNRGSPSLGLFAFRGCTGSELNGCLVENTGEFFRPDDELFKNFNFISRCTFKNLINCIVFDKYVQFGEEWENSTITSSLFENCQDVVTGTTSITNSRFENCENVAVSVMSVKDCQFIGCKEKIIESFGRSVKEDSLKGWHYESDFNIEGCGFYNSKTKVYSIIHVENDGKRLISDCVFDGLEFDCLTPLGLGLAGSDGTGHITDLINCVFKNCFSDNGDSLFDETSNYGRSFFKGEQIVRNVNVQNCRGLKNINKEGKEADEIPIRRETEDGTVIGSTLENDEAGVFGYDPTAE